MTQPLSFNHDQRIAHRGGAGTAPENTLAAFRQAADFGLTSIELDVSLLKDGSVAIWHDETLDRCSNATGKLSERTENDLKGIDAGGYFSDDFKGEPIAMLDETLLLLQDLGMSLNLEIKVHGDEAKEIAEKTYAAVSRLWKDNAQLVISSFDWSTLEHLRSLSSELNLGLLMEDFDTPWQETAKSLQAYSIHCDYTAVTAEIVPEIHNSGYQLFVYTVNEPAEATRLLTLGVDAIISDYPAKITRTTSAA